MISPSTGIISPLRTSTTSPTCSAARGISWLSPWSLVLCSLSPPDPADPVDTANATNPFAPVAKGEIAGLSFPAVISIVASATLSTSFISGAWASRALLGRRSSPPCMALRARTKALPSRCEAKATSTTTISASDQAPSHTAPMTASEVSTWNPNCLLRMLAAASANIRQPPMTTPGRPIATRIHGEVPITSPIITNTSSGIAMAPPSRRSWSGRNRDVAARRSCTSFPVKLRRASSRPSIISGDESLGTCTNTRSSLESSTSRSPG